MTRAAYFHYLIARILNFTPGISNVNRRSTGKEVTYMGFVFHTPDGMLGDKNVIQSKIIDDTVFIKITPLI